jgi:hypothetical protein
LVAGDCTKLLIRGTGVVDVAGSEGQYRSVLAALRIANAAIPAAGNP